jgi:hypothetical protein
MLSCAADAASATYPLEGRQRCASPGCTSLLQVAGDRAEAEPCARTDERQGFLRYRLEYRGQVAMKALFQLCLSTD